MPTTEPSTRSIAKFWIKDPATRKAAIVSMALLVFVAASYLLIGTDLVLKKQPPNTDPTVGWVLVNDEELRPGFNQPVVEIHKKCDGTVMMYMAGSKRISTVGGHPECR